MEDKRDLENEVYKSKLRFHTTAMITDNGSDDKKSQGILLTVPLFPAGMKMHLKNVKLVTSAVNTCKSQTAITAETRNGVYTEIYNRKYTLELQEAFDNLLNKLANLEKQVQSGDNKKYTLEDINKVRQFLQDIKEGIGNNDGNIAGNIYEFSMLGTDLVATIDRIRSEKVKTWALAFAGYNDVDHNSLVTDDKKRNPVDIFFGDSINTKNGSDLKTLIGSYSLEYINEQFKSKLKDKDFSKELRDSSSERNYGYNYFLCYFVQALLQIVLIDNEKMLDKMDCAIIKSNWDKFLEELSNPYLKNMFDEYNPGEIEDQGCPREFVNFMLNKLLGKDLIKKLDIDNARCTNYAEESISISKSLSMADHANQIITMGFEHNSDNFTYDNSLFIGQGEFVYTPIYKAYKNMDDDLKRKLRLLAFELKTKKIKLDQSKDTTSDEYKFGRIQEVKYQYKTVSKDGKNELIRDGITDIKYKVPNDYDTDISAEDLMDLVLKVQNIEKDFNDKLQEAISAFDKDKTNSFLDVLIEFQQADIYLNDNQIESILKKPGITRAMFEVINQENCDPKYISLYGWFINNHQKVVESINLDDLKFDLLTADSLYTLFNRKEDQKNKSFNIDDKAGLLLQFWKNNAFNEKLIEFINSDINIIATMFDKDKECTNQIIMKFLNQLNITIIRNIDLADKSLSDYQLNAIFYNKHKSLLKSQIQKIDCSKLNALSINILFEEHLADISQDNVNTFSDIVLKELTISRLVQLLKKNSNLDFSKHTNWLQSLYLDELYLKLKNKNNKPFVRFIAKHIDIFSKNQILSLRKYVFEEFKDDTALKDDAAKVLKRLEEIEKKGELEKNIVKITGIIVTEDNSYVRQATAILVHIYQKSPDELEKLLSYLIKNNESFAWYVNQVFWSILFERDNESIEKLFSNYKQMYEKISNDDKDKYKQLNKDDFSTHLLKIRETFKTVLKKDKDPEDAGKGKNINYLCLPKLTWIIDEINKLQDLSDLLSDEQIQSINISNDFLSLEDLYSLLDKFGNRMKYEQFYKLVSSFNNKKIELLKDNNIPGKDDSISSSFLAKIALINNFINEKEKEFKTEYFKIDDEFEEALSDLDSIITTVAVQIHPGNGAEQTEYCNNNTHHRKLYEKSDNTENIHNVAKDDKKILDELTELNDDLNNKIKPLKEKAELSNQINELKEKIESSRIEMKGIKKKLEEIKLLNESGEKTELNNQIDELKRKIESGTIEMEDIKEKLEKIKLTNDKDLRNDLEKELLDIKQKMQEFDRLYYGQKNKFAKLKTNFLLALKNLDTKKVSICFRNIYKRLSDKSQNSLENILDRHKIFWKLDPIVIKIGDKKKEYTFNEFFMDGFIKIQSGKKQDGTESNFSFQQKQSMGIINVVNKTEQKDEENVQEIKVTEVEQYTPEYMLENLPFVLESFHCSDDALEDEMKKVGLFDLTLKFDKNSKKSLERFIDSENLKFIEIVAADNGDDRQRIADRNEANHRYFKAVRKLFCKKADEIAKNADLVFEIDNQNKFFVCSSKSIQGEFKLQLKNLTQEVKDGTASCLGKEVIINNLTKMNAVPREHFLFFCGDWICHRSEFFSEKTCLADLNEFKDIVKKRIGFACKGRNQTNQTIGQLELTDEAYNLLTAVTLLSGLKAADKLKDMDKTVIDEICFLITGKKENFSLDDAQLIMKATKALDRSVAESIVKNVIKNQDYKYTFTFIHAFDLEYKAYHNEKIKFIECIGNRDKEIDFMSVISDIDKFNFYPDDNYGHYDENNERKVTLNFSFMQKLMDQLLQKYEFDVFPTAQQKEALGKFLKKFIVDNDEFEKNKHEVSNFFTKLMKKAPAEKSKDVTKEIIRICSNLRERSQRATILKDVLDASNNSLEGLELLEVLEQHKYARGLEEHYQSLTPIEFDGDLIEKLISDITKKPLPLTKKEVKRLEWFCENSKPKKSISSGNQPNLFLQLIQKMPEGSMSLDMCLNLITKFFPDLSKKIEYQSEIRYIETATVLNLINLDSDKNDIIKNLAYALPENQLSEIVRLKEPSLWDGDNCDYKDKKGKKYVWSEQINTEYASDTDRYQIVARKEQKDKKAQEEAAEKEEAKKERAKKMITVLNKLDANKIKKITAWTQFKQKCKSAKEQEQKNKDDIIKENYINDNLNENNIINDEKKDNIVDENRENHSNNNEIKENKEESKINNASIDENGNSIKTNEIPKGFININQPYNNNNNEDQSHKNIQEEKEKEVESSGNKNINNDINKNEEPKIDNNNKIIIKKEIKTEEKKKENINGQIKNKNKFNTNDQIDKNQKNSTVIINDNIIINNNSNSDNPYTLSAWLGFLPVIPAIIFGVKTQHKLTGGDIALIIVGIFPIISAIVFGILAYKYNQNILDKKTQENLKYTSDHNQNDINNDIENDIDIHNDGKIEPSKLITDNDQNPNYKGNMDRNNNIKKDEKENNKEEKTNPFSLIAKGEKTNPLNLIANSKRKLSQNQNQNQNQQEQDRQTQ